MLVVYLRTLVPPAGTRYVLLALSPKSLPIQSTVPVASTAGMLDEFAAVTSLPGASGSLIDMHVGSTSVIFKRCKGTGAGFEKVTVQVTGPPESSKSEEGETDFSAVRA